MKRRCVLVVDDHDGNRMTMAALLEDAGFDVGEADGVAAANRALGEAPFDLVLLDWNLGDGTGADVLTALPTDAAPKVIVLSGDTQAVGSRGILVWSIIEKGGPFEEVRAVIERALEDGSSRPPKASPHRPRGE